MRTKLYVFTLETLKPSVVASLSLSCWLAVITCHYLLCAAAHQHHCLPGKVVRKNMCEDVLFLRSAFVTLCRHKSDNRCAGGFKRELQGREDVCKGSWLFVALHFQSAIMIVRYGERSLCFFVFLWYLSVLEQLVDTWYTLLLKHFWNHCCLFLSDLLLGDFGTWFLTFQHIWWCSIYSNFIFNSFAKTVKQTNGVLLLNSEFLCLDY